MKIKVIAAMMVTSHHVYAGRWYQPLEENECSFIATTFESIEKVDNQKLLIGGKKNSKKAINNMLFSTDP